MSHVSNSLTWQPSATFKNLTLRAQILKQVRQFFADRHVLEVETPLLASHTVTDPHLHSFSVNHLNNKPYYLQTSPEYAMKRLLAAGSGCIYQICKAFRSEEQGTQHNPEFTMLEWYRVGFDHYQLMDEVELLIQSLLNTPPFERLSYTQLFEQYLNITVHDCATETLQSYLKEKGWLPHHGNNIDRDTCLQLLMSRAIEPHLGQETPAFVYDFPPSQAALARIRPGKIPVAERFELYIQGLELANGFHELADPIEQAQRFSHNQKQRQQAGGRIPDIDPYFLAALEQGLPHCAGVALGIDRLLMLASNTSHIHDVLAFPWDRS